MSVRLLGASQVRQILERAAAESKEQIKVIIAGGMEALQPLK